jgi:hypothetical protein
MKNLQLLLYQKEIDPMKYFLIVICISFFAFVIPTDSVYEQVEKSFNNQDANELIFHSKSKIFISILGKEAIYSKQQSIQLLKDFFSKKPVEHFKFTFKGKESAEGVFALGGYKTKDLEYRVIIHFVRENTTYLIERISIE